MGKLRSILIALCSSSFFFFALPVYNYWQGAGNQNIKKNVNSVEIERLAFNKKKPPKKKKLKLTKTERPKRKKNSFDDRFKLKLTAGGTGTELTADDLKNLIYEEGDVDQLPEVLNQQVVKIPAAARAVSLSGRFELEVVIDESGKVENVRYVTGPEGYDFERVTVSSAQFLRFRPAEKNGIPVKFRAIIPFYFGS